MKAIDIVTADLLIVGEGLYRVIDRYHSASLSRPAMFLVARVDRGTVIPSGVERAEIRPDGLRLILQWQPVFPQKEVYAAAILSPREGTQRQEDQELTDVLARRDRQTSPEGQPAASTDRGTP